MNLYTLLPGLIFVGGGLLIIWGTDGCRRNPEKCPDIFMTSNGWSQSIFGYWFFFGRPQAAREAIVANSRLRRWFVIESYIKGILFLLFGVYVLYLGL